MNCPNCNFPECIHGRSMVYTLGKRCPCCTYLEEVAPADVERVVQDFMRLTAEERQEFLKRVCPGTFDKPECSICRRRHGPEIEHPCE